jgi:hypothetical protein
MTQSVPSIVAKPDRGSLAPSPEYRWISRGSTLNPAPGPLLKRRRDPAEDCDRDAAKVRAKLPQRVQIGVGRRRNSTELTLTEIADDAAVSERQCGQALGSRRSRAARVMPRKLLREAACCVRGRAQIVIPPMPLQRSLSFSCLPARPCFSLW